MIRHPHVKVNLGLDVLRKRPDGYHDLETLFVPYRGIQDTLEVVSGDDYSRTSASLQARYAPEEIAQGISPDGKLMMTIARKGGVDWEAVQDLCAKAYGLLDKDFQLPPVKIFLEKTAPVGAGLGGGSSDAAFTLRMLDELFGLHLDREQLAGYAARLGSDCAFFIYDGPMIGRGRGEILSPWTLPELDWEGTHPEKPYVLQVVVPEGIQVSTAEAYRGIRPRETAPRTEGGRSLEEILPLPITQWKDLLINDFEKTVFAIHPELAAIKQSLYDSGAVYAAMSGSGSALLGIYPKISTSSPL